MSPHAVRPTSSDLDDRLRRFRGVALRQQLHSAGVPAAEIAARLADLQWRRVGPAIVLHYGPLTDEQQLRLTLFGHRGRGVLASFTALEAYGLQGWQRPEFHVLTPSGTPAFQHPELPLIVLHVDDELSTDARQQVETAPSAAVRAAASCPTPRLACGLLAAVVSQGIAPWTALAKALERPPAGQLRHHAAMTAAIADMAQGLNALADVDFADLCRSRKLPTPLQQRARGDTAGRRRYLEAVWELPDGHPLVIEVDCALHLSARRWWDENLRPSGFIASANGMFRVPSAVIRHEPDLVLGVVRREFDARRAAG